MINIQSTILSGTLNINCVTWATFMSSNRVGEIAHMVTAHKPSRDAYNICVAPTIARFPPGQRQEWGEWDGQIQVGKLMEIWGWRLGRAGHRVHPPKLPFSPGELISIV